MTPLLFFSLSFQRSDVFIATEIQCRIQFQEEPYFQFFYSQNSKKKNLFGVSNCPIRPNQPVQRKTILVKYLNHSIGEKDADQTNYSWPYIYGRFALLASIEYSLVGQRHPWSATVLGSRLVFWWCSGFSIFLLDVVERSQEYIITESQLRGICLCISSLILSPRWWTK